MGWRLPPLTSVTTDAITKTMLVNGSECYVRPFARDMSRVQITYFFMVGTRSVINFQTYELRYDSCLNAFYFAIQKNNKT